MYFDIVVLNLLSLYGTKLVSSANNAVFGFQ